MAVKGLASMQDQYMLDIFTLELPNDQQVLGVWVEMERGSGYPLYNFVARAKIPHSTDSSDFIEVLEYFAHANSIEKALLELAAEIVIKYPVKDNEQIDINIPVSKIVHTDTFNAWFRLTEKGDNR